VFARQQKLQSSIPIRPDATKNTHTIPLLIRLVQDLARMDGLRCSLHNRLDIIQSREWEPMAYRRESLLDLLIALLIVHVAHGALRRSHAPVSDFGCDRVANDRKRLKELTRYTCFESSAQISEAVLQAVESALMHTQLLRLGRLGDARYGWVTTTVRPDSLAERAELFIRHAVLQHAMQHATVLRAIRCPRVGGVARAWRTNGV
jgi:hypothetical protein